MDPSVFIIQEFSKPNLVYDFLIGLLISGIFYYVVVMLPEERRRKIMKKNLETQYRNFKKSMISIFKQAGDIAMTRRREELVLNPVNFRNFFHQEFNESQNNWHAVMNGLERSDLLIKETLVELEILHNEVQFILNRIELHDEDVFAFFKRLSETIVRLRSDVEIDNDRLFGFLWEIFAGWNFITGSQDEDIIEVMLRKI